MRRIPQNRTASRLAFWAAACAAAMLLPVAGGAGAGALTAPAAGAGTPSSSLGLPPLSMAQQYVLAPSSRTVVPSAVSESTPVNDDYVQAGSPGDETNGHGLDPGTSSTTRVDGVTVRQAGASQPGGYFSYVMHAPAQQKLTVRVEEAGSASSDYSVLVNGVQAYHRAPDPQQSGSWDGMDGLVHYAFTVPASALAPSAAAPGPGELRVTFVNSGQPGDGARIAGMWVSSPGGTPAAPYGGTAAAASATAPSAGSPGGGGVALSASTFGRPYAIFDFGQETGGQIQLTTTNPGAQTSLELAFSESWQYMTSASDFSEDSVGVATETHQLTVPAGTTQLTDPVIRGGFRYLMVYLGQPGSVSVSDLHLHYTPDPTATNPSAYAGAFLSSSHQLNQLWYAGAYSAQMATIDPTTGRAYPAQPGPVQNNATIASGPTAITDGAKRDRMDWVGDQAVEDPVSYLTTGNTQAAKDSFEFMAKGAAADGEVPGIYLPGSGYNFGWGEYAAWWARNYWTYYLYTGDKSFLDQWFPTLRGDISWFESLAGPDGLLNVPGGASGHWGYGNSGEETYDNALYVWTLQSAADAAQAEGQNALAVTYQNDAARTAAAINAKLWDAAAGAYVVDPGNGAHPQDGNVMAVLAGVATGQREASVLHFLSGQWSTYGAVTIDKPGNVVGQYVSPFMSYFELLAYSGQNTAAGTGDAMNLLGRTWPAMLTSTTGGTFWENLSLSGGPQLGSYTSGSHGWSGGPAPFLTNQVLGVAPTAGGFSTFQVLPHPPANLTWSEGTVPTPHGAITVAWKQAANGGLTLAVQAPAGTTYTAGVPAGQNQTVTANGQTIWTNGQPTAPGVTDSNGYIQMTGLTGTTTLVSTTH